MHGLANYAHRLDIAPQDQITRRFAKKFWDNLSQKGRVNELKLGLALYFINGIGEGIKTALKMKDIGLGLQKTKRMDPLEILGGHGIKRPGDLRKILDKAREIEDKKREENNRGM